MSRETLSQQAARRIREEINEGLIAPNSILTERDLAERLGISRTPLRSALSVLEREQVIERMENGALLVRRIAIEQLLDIIQLRLILERAAAVRAAEYGMTAELEAARGRQLRYLRAEPAKFEDFWVDDNDFHRAVAMAARLRLLPELLDEQRAIVRRSTIIRSHDNFADQAREHIAVINAIEARDADAAGAEMEKHFKHMRARTLGWLDKD